MITEELRECRSYKQRLNKVKKFFFNLCGTGEYLYKTDFQRDYQVYYFRKNKQEIKVLRAYGSDQLYLLLDDNLAKGYNYRSVSDMMSRDCVIDAFNDAKEKYRYWVLKRNYSVSS